ncbi:MULTISPECIES: sigma-70 family RNA polymerase sigma factor [unclassified Enterococcus]|uniref:sigma-70 family RNA polymerase sigma factor n=1 Tax=unclassified Enterococcus TaxID=2608891 RepID=UPI0015528073|nr:MULTISPECIES: sigma-70 family RNA polymerase sigma factor [unclassified Enterococcus]MBS7576827.1 sigma-70 family RNA polymerase sigma factor [Enterococcus sp. MMGLQ5-2]MBS7584234.1 sigma-70 family RNA polymerase sigma factor [Enterococcus sp. MMGLQ5-1]NPD12090.1 sigma-70 family RNA polymerase sigma factor [Enterococcus sp. MMGLQ5-1]NPD36662.1 sigma-70 family RNA polymerase sigma factor [Enterococcus sp. MMGLQ5-2]
MPETKQFKIWFKAVLPIIHRYWKLYYLNLWEYDDWLQEARIILHQVISLKTPEQQIIAHFSVKFKCHILDSLRRQDTAKRKANRQEYLVLDDENINIDLSVDYLVAEQTICKELFYNFFDKLTEKEAIFLKQIITDPTTPKDAKFRRLKRKLISNLYPSDS